ncbi:hypothetical protein V8G54_017622 [Vigna mungo]|uniref:Uncharacterized protein n=1 Tax=Vigna mungo TaxID=3915 RepID=A0AAQ3NPT5_VIGMU
MPTIRSTTHRLIQPFDHRIYQTHCTLFSNSRESFLCSQGHPLPPRHHCRKIAEPPRMRLEQSSLSTSLYFYLCSLRRQLESKLHTCMLLHWSPENTEQQTSDPI